MQNNVVELIGVVADEFEYSHDMVGKRFYHSTLEVKRSSGTVDYIPILAEQSLIEDDHYASKRVQIVGEYRSFNDCRHLKLNVYVRQIFVIEDDIGVTNRNLIFISGYICKKPILRITPFGKSISDVLLAVNRQYGKTDYIPCVFWGKCARDINNLEIGAHVEVTGRIQSRTYIKDGELNTAYELSASTLEVINECHN